MGNHYQIGDRVVALHDIHEGVDKRVCIASGTELVIRQIGGEFPFWVSAADGHDWYGVESNEIEGVQYDDGRSNAAAA
jgi:hypothetical protein